MLALTTKCASYTGASTALLETCAVDRASFQYATFADLLRIALAKARCDKPPNGFASFRAEGVAGEKA